MRNQGMKSTSKRARQDERLDKGGKPKDRKQGKDKSHSLLVVSSFSFCFIAEDFHTNVSI